jgi:hypothetical protein
MGPRFIRTQKRRVVAANAAMPFWVQWGRVLTNAEGAEQRAALLYLRFSRSGRGGYNSANV